VYVTPKSPKQWRKIAILLLWLIKLTILLINICCKFFTLQHLAAILQKISDLSNDATMLAENVTVQPNILLQINSPNSKCNDFDVIPVVVPQAKSQQ